MDLFRQTLNTSYCNQHLFRTFLATIYLLVEQVASIGLVQNPLFVNGIVAFVDSATGLGFFSLLFKQVTGLPPWMVEPSGLIIVVILYLLISGWVI